MEQPDRAGAENSAGFCLGRVRSVRALWGPVCGARGFASQAETREATGPRPGGTKTALRGAFAGLGLAHTVGKLTASSQEARPVDRNRRDGAPAGASPRSQEGSPPQGGIQDESADRRSVPFARAEGTREKSAYPAPQQQGRSCTSV